MKIVNIGLVLFIMLNSCTKTATKEIVSPTPTPPSSTTPTTPTPTVPKFSIGSGFDNTVIVSKWTNDGKIICGGLFKFYNNKSVNYLARLNSNGSLDSTFNVPKEINNWIRDLVIQPDGKIIVGGQSGIFLRLNNDGSIDNTFKIGSGFKTLFYEPQITQILLNKDGTIFVIGSFDSYNSDNMRTIIKLKSDGSVDKSFKYSNGGIDANGGVSSIKTNILQNDGRILASSISTGPGSKSLFRINKDGVIDSASLKISNDNNSILSIVEQIDGKYLIGGNFEKFNGLTSKNIVRLNSDGSVDNTFNVGIGFDNIVYEIALQNDGKIIVAGKFNKYNNSTQNHIVRLNTNGSIDDTFNSKEGFYDSTGVSNSNTQFNISFNPDGRILLSGGFIFYRGIRQHHITLINKDGTIYE